MSRYTAFRCPDELLRRAKRTADSERRSLSNYIIRLLEQDLVKRAALDMRYNEQEETSKRLYRTTNKA